MNKIAKDEILSYSSTATLSVNQNETLIVIYDWTNLMDFNIVPNENCHLYFPMVQERVRFQYYNESTTL